MKSKYKADLGNLGGTLFSYPDETKEEFEKRCYIIAMFASPGEIKVVENE